MWSTVEYCGVLWSTVEYCKTLEGSMLRCDSVVLSVKETYRGARAAAGDSDDRGARAAAGDSIDRGARAAGDRCGLKVLGAEARSPCNDTN